MSDELLLTAIWFLPVIAIPIFVIGALIESRKPPQVGKE